MWPQRSVYPLNVLPLPDPNANAQSIGRADAVRLFVDRARQYRPQFRPGGTTGARVAEICVRLDGIPLALELAAARVAVLPVEEIVKLLDQRFRLLTRGRRRHLRDNRRCARCSTGATSCSTQRSSSCSPGWSVFAGGWTLVAAQGICAGDPVAKEEVVYLLIALIEKSLVVADEDGDRYRMLETVREYAQEKLTESGTAEACAQRRDYFLSLAEEAQPKLARCGAGCVVATARRRTPEPAGRPRLESHGTGIVTKSAAQRGAAPILAHARASRGGPGLVRTGPTQIRKYGSNAGTRKGARCGGPAGLFSGGLSHRSGTTHGFLGDPA